LEKAIWAELGTESELPSTLGQIGEGTRSEPLAITQLLLLYHMLDSVR
jgi:phosphoribulokinase